MALLYVKASDGYLASIPVNVMGFIHLRDKQNGWQRLPNGVVLEWGGMTWSSSSNYEGTKTIELPISLSAIYSTIGILIIPNSKYPDVALQLCSNTTNSITFGVQMMASDAPSCGFQYIAIGSCTGVMVENTLKVYVNGTLQYNATVTVNNMSYTTNSSGMITLIGSLNSTVIYTISSGEYTGTISITFNGSSTYTVNLTTLRSYTVTISGTDTNKQTLRVVYNSRTYENTGSFTIVHGNSVNITSVSKYVYDYSPGSISINGTSTGSSSYTYTVTGNVTISNESPLYIGCYDSGGEG